MTEPSQAALTARKEKLARAESLGIDHRLIDRIVEAFYARVRADPLLAPVFAARIADWPPHLARMKAFWMAILRGEGRFSGNPMQLHAAIPGIEHAEFARWLALFEAALDEVGADPGAAGLIAGRARAIADSLLTGIRIHRDRRTDRQALKGMAHA